jgi:hypothetical protein
LIRPRARSRTQARRHAHAIAGTWLTDRALLSDADRRLAVGTLRAGLAYVAIAAVYAWTGARVQALPRALVIALLSDGSEALGRGRGAIDALAGAGQAIVQRPRARALRHPGSALADFGDRVAATTACIFLAAASEIQIRAAQRCITGAARRGAPAPVRGARLRTARRRTTVLASVGIALHALLSGTLRGSSGAGLGGLKRAFVVAGLDLVIETLSFVFRALAAGFGAVQTGRGRSAAGGGDFPVAAVRKAAFDCVGGTAEVTRGAGDTGALETGCFRSAAPALVHPLTGAAAELRPRIRTARSTGLARLAIASDAERPAHAGRGGTPISVGVARLRLVHRLRVAAFGIRHACPRTGIVAAQKFTHFVGDVRTARAFLEHLIAVALGAALRARVHARASLTGLVANAIREPATIGANLDGAVLTRVVPLLTGHAFTAETRDRARSAGGEPFALGGAPERDGALTADFTQGAGVRRAGSGEATRP